MFPMLLDQVGVGHACDVVAHDAMHGFFPGLCEVRGRKLGRMLHEKTEQPFESANDLVAFGAERAVGVELPEQEVFELAILPPARRAELNHPPPQRAHLGDGADAPVAQASLGGPNEVGDEGINQPLERFIEFKLFDCPRVFPFDGADQADS